VKISIVILLAIQVLSGAFLFKLTSENRTIINGLNNMSKLNIRANIGQDKTLQSQTKLNNLIVGYLNIVNKELHKLDKRILAQENKNGN